MTVVELIKHLEQFDYTAEVAYKDMNFGGPSEPLEKEHITFLPRSEGLNSILLFDSPAWTEVEEES